MPRDEKAILQLDGLMWQECLNISFDVSKVVRGVCEAEVVHHDRLWPLCHTLTSTQSYLHHDCTMLMSAHMPAVCIMLMLALKRTCMTRRHQHNASYI